MHRITRYLPAALVILAAAAGGYAQAADTLSVGNARAGRNHAVQVCAECHDVRPRETGTPSKSGAPGFHAIANAKTTSAMGLNVFLVTPHPTMPNLIIGEEDRRDLIAYILSLRDAREPGPK